MKRSILLLSLTMLLGACATTPRLSQYADGNNTVHISGEIKQGIGGPGGLQIGLIADSQLQTRSNSRHVRGYRTKFADAAVNVAIRPPALDYASRALLRRQLDNLKNRGATAIFYLGDGANNGCGDELLAGWDPEFRAGHEDEEGLLKILDRFREANPNIPVFFVIGNHDFLGAGSTPKIRDRFCDPDEQELPRHNRALTKLQVMTAIDTFNRSNRDNWGYTTNFSKDHARICGLVPERQFATRGCYLSAVLNKEVDGLRTQIVLLDSNDWTDVKRFWLFGEQLGVWGGISYAPGPPISQIDWLEQNASDYVPMRLFMSHYNVGAIVKESWFGSLSHLSRHLPRLVSTPAVPRKRKQDDAYFITAHTHDPVVEESDRSELLAPGCPEASCKPTQLVVTRELNIGSTTDYRNSSTILLVRPAAGAKGSIEFEQLYADPTAQCRRYEDYIKANQASFGIIPGKEFDYVTHSHAQNRRIWDYLRNSAVTDPLIPICVGLYAARIEERVLEEGREHRVKE